MAIRYILSAASVMALLATGAIAQATPSGDGRGAVGQPVFTYRVLDEFPSIDPAC